MKKLEEIRLEVDSRRRTVADLSAKVEKQRARLPQTRAKGEDEMQNTIKTMQHKENKLAGAGVAGCSPPADLPALFSKLRCKAALHKVWQDSLTRMLMLVPRSHCLLVRSCSTGGSRGLSLARSTYFDGTCSTTMSAVTRIDTNRC